MSRSNKDIYTHFPSLLPHIALLLDPPDLPLKVLRLHVDLAQPNRKRSVNPLCPISNDDHPLLDGILNVLLRDVELLLEQLYLPH